MRLQETPNADSACMSAVPAGRGGNAQIVLIYASWRIRTKVALQHPAAEVGGNTACVIRLALRVGFELAGHVPSGRMRVAGSAARTRRRSSCRWPRRPPAAAW
jgi:hypothetical protein